MIMKKYSYNADFFGQWFEKSGIKLTQLMKDLGVNNVSLKRWMKDKSNPLPIEKMVLLCNLYDIELSEFFLDGESPATVIPKTAHRASVRGDERLQSEATKNEKNEKENTSQMEILQMKIDHMQEIQRIKDEQLKKEAQLRKEYQNREDDMRRQYEERISQYEARIDEYKEMVRDGMQTTRLALTQGGRQSSLGGYGTEGVADYSDAPRPHVNPKKR